MTVKALVAAFILIEAVAALGMLVISVHGPAGMGIAAPVYLVVAATVTWWVAHRFANAGAVIGIGIPLLVAPLGILALLGRLERIAYERRVAATRIDSVRDEAILSTKGQPIGVRVAYSVTVPARGYFAILPALYSRDPRAERLYLGSSKWTIDGRSEPIPFERGKTHAVDVELYPAILAFNRDGRCIATALVPTLPDSSRREPLKISISDSRYGQTYDSGVERLTANAYDLAELYRNVLAEGIAPCRQP